MEQIKIYNKLTTEEKEVHLSMDASDRVWRMDTTIMKWYNKAVKQGWKMLKQYIYAEDNSIAGGLFEAPERSITIRNTEKKEMSEKQLGNLFDDED